MSILDTEALQANEPALTFLAPSMTAGHGRSLSIHEPASRGKSDGAFASDNSSDNDLMWMVRDGDIEKLGVLFQRHRRALLAFFTRMTSNHASSEDLVQDVFLRILKYRHTFGGRGDFCAWMYRIARNTHLKQRHKLRHEAPLHDEDHPVEIASEEPTPDQVLSRAQDVHLLKTTLAQLPREKQELLWLSRLQSLRYKEIARRLKCDVGTVKVRVFRATQEAQRTFRKLMGENRWRTGWSGRFSSLEAPSTECAQTPQALTR